MKKAKKDIWKNVTKFYTKLRHQNHYCQTNRNKKTLLKN